MAEANDTVFRTMLETLKLRDELIEKRAETIAFLDRAEAKVDKLISDLSVRMGLPIDTTASVFKPRRSRSSVKADLDRCYEYIKAQNRPVHVTELLRAALNQSLSLENRNRLTARLFNEVAKKEKSRFKKTAPATFGLRMNKEVEFQEQRSAA